MLGIVIAEVAWFAWCQVCGILWRPVRWGVKFAKWIYLVLTFTMFGAAYGSGHLRERAFDCGMAFLIWFTLRILDQMVLPWLTRNVIPQYVPRS
jgi:hypothetical protein